MNKDDWYAAGFLAKEDANKLKMKLVFVTEEIDIERISVASSRDFVTIEGRIPTNRTKIEFFISLTEKINSPSDFQKIVDSKFWGGLRIFKRQNQTNEEIFVMFISHFKNSDSEDTAILDDIFDEFESEKET